MDDPLVDWPRDRLLSIVMLGRRFGVFENDLLAGTGYTLPRISDPREQPPVRVEFEAIRNLQRIVGPDVPLGLYAGLDFHLRVSGQWGQALTTSQRFGEALVTAKEYFDLTFSLVQVSVSAEDSDFIVHYVAEHLPQDVRFFLTCRSLIASSVIARELLGHTLPLKSLTMGFPKPTYAERFTEFADVDIRWEAGDTAARADISWLQQPLASADADSHQRAVQACRLLMRRNRLREGPSAKVRQHLTADGVTAATLDGTALALGISPRTLRRQLQMQGTSFQSLLDDARLEQAARFLLLGLSVEETARRVGYAGPSAFGHAFRRWTGTTPDLWRRSPLRDRGYLEDGEYGRRPHLYDVSGRRTDT